MLEEWWKITEIKGHYAEKNTIQDTSQSNHAHSQTIITYCQHVLLNIAVLLAVFSTGAMAEWTYLGSAENKTYDVYIDKVAIRKQGNVAKMWDMFDYKSPRKTANGTSYSSDKSLGEYDCVEIRNRNLSTTYYSDNRGKGAAVLTHQYDDAKWGDIVPGSVSMAKWEVACKE